MTIGQAIEKALEIREEYKRELEKDIEVYFSTYKDVMIIRATYYAEQEYTTSLAYHMKFEPAECLVECVELIFKEFRRIDKEQQ